MDVVAAGAILDWLGDVSWSVSDLPLGSGLVKTQHGLLPVPPPATAALLDGFRWRDDGEGGERVTPTGAAILRYVVGDPSAGPRGGRLVASGVGAGTRELGGMPNVLRVLAFEVSLGRNVDEAVGRAQAIACDTDLFARHVVAFHLLCEPAHLDEVQRLAFSETSTIGLRWRFEQRARLERRDLVSEHDSPTLRVKEVVRSEGVVTRKAESDDLRNYPGLDRRRGLKARAEKGDEI